MRSRAVAVLVAGTFFMELLDGTIVSTAAPRIARDLHVDSPSVGVAITAYLVTLAVLIPISGWLTDRIGTRTVFIGAIAVFTIASGLCALSQSLPELIGWRVLQGVGGAMMVPVGRLVVLRGATGAQIVSAIAIITWPALAAPIVAPFVGGLITTYLTWQWIFLINLPLGAVAFVGALVLVPQERSANRVPFDWFGAVAACAGLGAVVVVGSLLSADSVNWIAVVVFAIIGAAGCVFAVSHLRRHRFPLLRLTSLRLETFRIAHAGGSLFRLAVGAVPFVLPLLFQDAFHWSPVQAGSAVLFVFVGNLGIKPTTTPLLRRFGFRPVLLVSTAIAALSVAAMVLLSPSTPFWILAVLLIISGAARSVGFTVYNTIAFAEIAQPDMTAANTLSSTLQQVAAGFGITIAAVVLRAAASTATPAHPYAAYQVTFAVLGVFLLASFVEAILLSRDAGIGIRPTPRIRTAA